MNLPTSLRIFAVLFFSFLMLALASCNKPEEDGFYHLKITVVDADEQPVEGASVKMFFTEDDMLKDVLMLDEKKTDRGGNVYFTLVHPFYSTYYVDVSKDILNNWRGKTTVKLQRSILNEHKIYIEKSIETLISGKLEKEWLLTKYLFNGDEGKGCTFNTRNIFYSYGFFDSYSTNDADCSRPNALMSTDRWIVSPDRKAIYSGSISNPKVRQIVELTAEKMVFLIDYGLVKIEETYEVKK